MPSGAFGGEIVGGGAGGDRHQKSVHSDNIGAFLHWSLPFLCLLQRERMGNGTAERNEKGKGKR